MQVLIVEDNAFNAFCMARLFETICSNTEVSVAKNSLEAITNIDAIAPDLVVLDGNLQALDGDQCNGPALADYIWRRCPRMPIVAWTDHEGMIKKFKDVFATHLKPFNEVTAWPKSMDYTKLYQAITTLSLKYDLDLFCHNPEAYHFQRLYS